jgi:hypothetical protein
MLIRESLPAGTPVYNLLDQRLWLDLSVDPSRMRQELEARDLRGLGALAKEGAMKRLLFVCQEPTPRKIGDIFVLPLQEFQSQLWSDAFAE